MWSLPLCTPPYWEEGCVSSCVQRTYIHIAIPALTCLVSFVLLNFRVYRIRSKAQFVPYVPLPTYQQGLDDGQNVTMPRYIPLQPLAVRSHKLQTAILEPLTLLTDAAIQLSLLTSRSTTQHATVYVSVTIVCSIYAFILTCCRMLCQSKRPNLARTLWSHSSSIYTVWWLATFWSVEAVLADWTWNPETWASLSHFSLITLMLVFMLTATPSFASATTSHDLYSHPESKAPEVQASLSSLFTFGWVGSLVWKGYRTPLENGDLGELPPAQCSAQIAGILDALTVRTDLSFTWQLFTYFKRDILWQAIWAACASMVMFLPAVLIRAVLDYLADTDRMHRATVWLCIAGLLMAGVVTSGAECQTEWIGRKIAARLRAIVIHKIHAKILVRTLGTSDQAAVRRRQPSVENDENATQVEPPSDSNDHKGNVPSANEGAIMTLMTVDCSKIALVSAHLHLLWVSIPLQLLTASGMLYSLMGLSGLAGLALMILLLPLNILLAKYQGEAQGTILTATDARVQSITEILKNIRLVKFNAWDSHFSDKIESLRRTELNRLRFKFMLWSLSMTVWYSIPLLVALVTLLFYTIVAKQDLTTAIAFPALAVFGILRMPLDRAADMISFVLQARISLQRLSHFLQEDELSPGECHDMNTDLHFTKATLTWQSNTTLERFNDPGPNDPEPANSAVSHANGSAKCQFQLTDMNFQIQPQSLNIVCGPSGSGKSSLLLALLGEMELVGGEAVTRRTLFIDPTTRAASPDVMRHGFAYCPQEPWILNESVQSNIIFGASFERQRYSAVLEACALSRDMSLLDDGDKTIAGNRGSRLSGGQRQRVALARALYSRAQYVLLDDCLSALDPTTAGHVFFRGIKGDLMKGRTCVLATHNTQLTLRHSDHIIWLEDGSISCQGTFRQLVSLGLASEVEATSKTDLGQIDSVSTSSHTGGKAAGDQTHPGDEQCDQHPNEVIYNSEDARLLEEHEEDEICIKMQEKKFTGAVAWSSIKHYFTSMGTTTFWGATLALFAAQQLASLATNIWIKQWAQRYDKIGKETNPKRLDQSNTVETVGDAYYLGFYAVLVLVFVGISFLRDALTFSGALEASQKLHRRLVKSVLGTSIAFFDSNSLGQIINRFSMDIDAVDQEIAPNSMSTFHLLATVATTLILVSVFVPMFLSVTIPIGLLYYMISLVYINSSRDLKRIESVARSPLYQHIGETIAGFVSIRAYSCSARFSAKMHNLIDCYNRPYVLNWASKEWLTFRVGIVSSLISASTGVFSLLWLGPSQAGAAGLIMAYATAFTENVVFLVQLYAGLQQSFSSIERLDEYIELAPESSSTAITLPAPTGWPAHGNVRFLNFATRYTPDSRPALTNICLDAKAGQRTAVVGRTGAGKSTLALALVRALDAYEGSITIDSINIATVSLQQLRRIMTVVPQDPNLFEGSIRMNIDPTNSFSDDEVMSALNLLCVFHRAEGANAIRMQLEQPTGSLSLGQRQLFCLARALLRQSRILILDEATASMDHITDNMIQNTLRESASRGTTVLTIAHRLRTVADYDYIYVLDAGRVAEEGTTKELLNRRNPDGLFRRLCMETGELEMIEKLASSAQDAFTSRV